MSSNATADRLWIRRFTPVSDYDTRVVCFPHAGGSASFYTPMMRALAARRGVDAVSVQYPGRQDRRDEPAIDDIGDLADAVFTALRPFTDVPLSLFGHSMGAVVAFEVALRLQDLTGVPPARLFVSGRRAPSRYRDGEHVHLRDDNGIVDELKLLSGTATQLLGNEEVMRLALPALRGDYRAIETYRPPERREVACPITVLTGNADPATSLEEAEAWELHSTAACEVVVFDGGHFFLSEHQSAIVSLVLDRIPARPDGEPVSAPSRRSTRR